MAPDRTILHLVKNNYGVHTIKPHLCPCNGSTFADKLFKPVFKIMAI